MIAVLLLLAPLTAAGIAAVRTAEGRSPLLAPLERVAAGYLLGTTGGMFAFWLGLLAGLPLTRATAGGLAALAAAIAAGLAVRLRGTSWRTDNDADPPLGPTARIVLPVLGALTALKLAVLAVTVALTPAYLDDTLSNWNLRAKVFFHTQSFTVQLPEGVNGELSSYPPAVPLLKASAAALHGEWSEPLANGLHALWYLALLALLHGTLRRWLPQAWALAALYAFASLPLPLLHGVHAYADTFLSAHLFAAVAFAVAAVRAEGARRDGFLRLAAVMGALLPFTKNEGLLIYGSLFALLYAWVALRAAPARARTLGFAALCALAVVVPWLAFKWSHGLTFGNAKAVTGLALGFEPQVFRAVAVHLFFEGNWHLLWPVALVALVLERRTAWLPALRPLTALCVAAFAAQVLIYVCTPLATEALRQTGFGRGIVHLTPLVVWLTAVLLYARSRRT